MNSFRPSVNRVITAATEELEEKDIPVTPASQYLLVNEWYDTWRKLARMPEDFELLIAIEKAEIRLFNRIVTSH